jgi:hypothetical protein
MERVVEWRAISILSHPSSMSLLVKPLTGLLGVVLTIVGIAGFFVPGMLLFFEVDTVHNVIHLASGLIALFAFNSSQAYSRWYLIVFGLIYGIVTVIGFAMGGDILGLFHVNDADNYLHLAIAAVSLIVGFGSGK